MSAWESCRPTGWRALRHHRFRRAANGVVLGAVAATGICCVARSGTAQTTKIVGKYVHAPGVAAQLEVTQDGDQYVVVLRGGSPAGAGAASPADCYVRAVGQLAQDVLKAQFAAVETETFLYTRARAAQEQRTLQISFTPGAAAEVTHADTDGYCGLGATFLGSYKRTSGDARSPAGKVGKP